ncbi:MAG: ATP-dependent DNA helicase [Phycisphaerae bacterium]
MTTSSTDRWAPMIARAIPHFEPRPQQTAMANAVAAALDSKKHLIVEAGTGVGKSFSYLLPAIHHILNNRRKRIVVATHTIALQEQLVEKDIPALTAVVDRPFKAVLVKGRNNYVALRRLELTSHRQESIFSTPAQVRQLHQIENWAYHTTDGSLSDLDFQPAGDLWQRVRSESNNCMGNRCPTFDQCFYQKARREASEAQLLIVNHALFFSDLALRGQHVSILPDYDAVIFDEAHNIESVAGDHMGLSISNLQVRFLLRGIFNERTGRGFIVMLEAPEIAKKVVDAEARNEALFDALRQAFPTRRGSARFNNSDGIVNLISPALNELSNDLKSLRKQFKREDELFELNALIRRCAEMATTIENLLAQNMKDHVYWLETAERPSPRTTLRAAPLKIDQVLREELFERTDSVILTSATMSTGGESGFAYLRGRLGIDDAIDLQLDSPFDYQQQVTIHVEASLPEPNAPDFVAAAVDRIQHYVLETGGRAFVLFTSYYAMNEAAKIMQPCCEANNLTLLVQGRNLPRGRMVERFKKTSRAVIFGTDSFWQGVDVPGDALQNVIIVKLPFAAPDRPLIEAHIDAIKEGGGNPFMEFQLPEAILKLKQGFGRLIRSRTDHGIVAILDPRIHTKFYGRKFLQALPPCRIETHR